MEVSSMDLEMEVFFDVVGKAKSKWYSMLSFPMHP